MKLYKWLGSEEEAVKVVNDLNNSPFVHLKNREESLLLCEAEDAPFTYTEAYEILDQTGELQGNGFAVLNNVPVTAEGKALFEQRFQNRAKLIEHEPGFIAIRVLRPLTSDTYVILTIWENSNAFTSWQDSQAYSKAHAKRGTEKGIDKRPNIFSRPSFVTTYQ